MPVSDISYVSDDKSAFMSTQNVEDFKKFAKKKEDEHVAKELAAIDAPVTKTKGKGGTEKNAKRQKTKKMTLKQVLLNTESGVSVLGSDIIEHCMLCSSAL